MEFISKEKPRSVTDAEFEVYKKVRLAVMREEIEFHTDSLGPDDDFLHGVKANEIKTDSFLNFAADQLDQHTNRLESDEIWNVLEDSYHMYQN